MSKGSNALKQKRLRKPSRAQRFPLRAAMMRQWPWWDGKYYETLASGSSKAGDATNSGWYLETADG